MKFQRTVGCELCIKQHFRLTLSDFCDLSMLLPRSNEVTPGCRLLTSIIVSPILQTQSHFPGLKRSIGSCAYCFFPNYVTQKLAPHQFIVCVFNALSLSVLGISQLSFLQQKSKTITRSVWACCCATLQIDSLMVKPKCRFNGGGF